MGTVLRIIAVALAMCMLAYPLTVDAAGGVLWMPKGQQFQGCETSPGIDFIGTTELVGQANANSAAECCRICYLDARCLYFSWWSADEANNSWGVANRCYLKTGSGTSKQNSKVTSGRVND